MTKEGPCSARCGDGEKTKTTISCGMTAASGYQCDRATTVHSCNEGSCPRKQFDLNILDQMRHQEKSGKILRITFLSLIGATEWQDWSPWSQCYFKDRSLATCWKDYEDQPIAKRTRACIKANSITDEEEVCNKDTRTCTNLPICAFGETSKSLILRPRILIKNLSYCFN